MILGFDLGDGESCAALLDEQSAIEPRVIPLMGQLSIISAVGVSKGRIVIGDEASVHRDTEDARVRFKSRYLTDPTAASDVRAFAQGVAAEIMRTDAGLLAKASRTVVGCPAGWGDGRRSQYAALMESAGFPNVEVVPESRAAFLYVRHARGLHLAPELMQNSAMVIDIGSSTTDFAYIVNGHQQDLSVFGDTNLGGGLLDEMILARAIEDSPDRDKLERVMKESTAWHSYCELEARRLKEKYFQSESAEKEISLTRRLLVCYDEELLLELKISSETIAELIRMPISALGGKSFLLCLQNALKSAAEVSRGCVPGVVILTGGASRMTFFKECVQKAFPESLMIMTPDPECAIARGLAYAGKVDENLAVFRRETESLAHGEALARAVNSSVFELYLPIAEVLYNTAVESALEAVAMWRGGALDTIEQLDGIIEEKISDAFKGSRVREQLEDAISQWLSKLLSTIEKELTLLCERCGIPPEHMALQGMPLHTGLSGVKLSVTDAMGMDVLSGLMGVVFAAIGAAVCGGGGIALITSGPVGIATGAAVGILLALLGKTGLQQIVQKIRIPVLVRQVVTDKAVRRGMDRQKEDIKRQIVASLADPSNGFSARLTSDLGNTLGAQLESMAKKAEMSITA